MDNFIMFKSKNEHVTIRLWVVIAYFILRLLEDSFISHKCRHASIHSTMKAVELFVLTIRQRRR